MNGVIKGILCSAGLSMPFLSQAIELELICTEANTQKNHQIYVLYQKDGVSYAYWNADKHGFGMDYWEYVKRSETQRDVFSAVYGSDELEFSKGSQVLKGEDWVTASLRKIHINRITGTFEIVEVSEVRKIIASGGCRPGKVKKF
jgi:hypothetical protein